MQLRSLLARVLLAMSVTSTLPAVDMLYVTLSGSNTIVSYDTSRGVGSAIAATVTTFANSQLNYPKGLAFDTSGNLYAANSGTNTISKFDSSGGYVSMISSNLSGPVGLAFDSSGNLYAANNTSKTISKFDSSGNFLTSWGTSGSSGTYLAFRPVSVPEPSTYALAAIATGVMAAIARRRKARKA